MLIFMKQNISSTFAVAGSPKTSHKTVLPFLKFPQGLGSQPELQVSFPMHYSEIVPKTVILMAVGRGGCREEEIQRMKLGAHLLFPHFEDGTYIYRTLMMLLNNQFSGCWLQIVNLTTSEQVLTQLYYFLCALFCQCLKQLKLEGWIAILEWDSGPLLCCKKVNLFQLELGMPACLASSPP